MGCDDRLAQCGAIMYDAEIYSAMPVQGVIRDQDIKYCGGWDDYEGMGISVVTAYDFVTSEWSVFLSDNLNDLKTLINSRQIIIGFNNRRFDDNLMAAHGIHIPESKSYDLWAAIVNTQPPGQRKGFALGEMLAANGIHEKSGLGADAPKHAQRGRWGFSITYCLGDTHKQVKLLRLACAGAMKNPKNGEYMKIKLPWEAIHIDTGGIFA